MPPYLTKNSRLKVKVLAWYQIIGGITGILLTIWLVAKTDTLSGLILLLFLLAAFLFSYSIYCGRLLLKGELKNGFAHTFINQTLQVFSFYLFGWGFKYISGGSLLVGISTSNTGFQFNFDFNIILSTFAFNVRSNESVFFLNINFLALLVIYLVDRLKTKINNEKLAYEEVQINVPNGTE